MLDFNDVPRLPPRADDAHKGTFGRVLVVAGSRGMSGAAILSGSSALRGGAGLVTVACPCEVQAIVAHGNPCYMTHGIPQHANCTYSEASAMELLPVAEAASVLAIGPGLGNRPDVRHLVLSLLQVDKPTVLDADGLNVLLTIPEELASRKSPIVMTPHPGEFAHLLGITTAEVQANRQALAVEFAKRWHVILLLKGHGTIVTDGNRVYMNATGNPGMATGGSGDVLTGLTAAFLMQGLPVFEATVLAAWVHGRAGDLAADSVGQVAMTASDILSHLPTAIRERS